MINGVIKRKCEGWDFISEHWENNILLQRDYYRKGHIKIKEFFYPSKNVKHKQYFHDYNIFLNKKFYEDGEYEKFSALKIMDLEEELKIENNKKLEKDKLEKQNKSKYKKDNKINNLFKFNEDINFGY